MRKFRQSLTAALIAVATILALVSPALVAPLEAQQTINQTTTSAAVTASAQSLPLTSVSTVAVGQYVFVDRELMGVTAINGSVLTVTRGQGSTFAAPHGSGSVVFTGPASYFAASEVSGACTSTAEPALPRIVPSTGNVYDCKNSKWVRWTFGGLPAFQVASLSGNTYTTAGAITIQPGLHFISGTTLAMTLANPTAAQDGMIMVILSANASAHTITYTAGFGGGTTTRDVGTFGGAVNDGLVIMASGGVWWVLSTRNVTLA